MTNMLDALRSPFPPDRVSWRVGPTNEDKSRGLALAYIDARDVADRLDEACGPAGWQCRYPHANGKTVCEIGILCEIAGAAEWIWKADGAGDTDKEAEKGALSDAFKRAAVRWGIARYLYDVPSPWVEIKQQGKSFVIKPEEFARLRQVLAGQAPTPEPPPIKLAASPANEQLASALILALRKQLTPGTLKAWGSRPEIKAKIAGLDDANAGRVRADYAGRLRMLTSQPPQTNGMHA